MARSRSSFELTSAIATASTLAREEKKKPGTPGADLAQLDAKSLVSFQLPEAPSPGASPPAAPPANVEHAPPRAARAEAEPVAATAMTSPPVVAIPPPPTTGADEASDGKRRPPRLPDLSNVVSPVVRCERIVEWIAEATGGSGVFIADAEGLPVAGEIHDAEALIGASGLVASSIATLLQALPGEPSPLFEVHIGEGPYFQLIGFQAANAAYVVGLWREDALSPRQAHAIRLACRHAFGESLGVASGSHKS